MEKPVYSTLASRRKDTHLTSPHMTCTFSPALPPNCEFVVNFSPELSEIIRESCYMEKLGFMVPDLARNVALQEEKFLAYCSDLNHCLNRYHTLLASLQDEVVHMYIHIDMYILHLHKHPSLKVMLRRQGTD